MNIDTESARLLALADAAQDVWAAARWSPQYTSDALRDFAALVRAQQEDAPQPRVPEERWANRYEWGLRGWYSNAKFAQMHADVDCIGQVLFREVMEEDGK